MGHHSTGRKTIKTLWTLSDVAKIGGGCEAKAPHPETNQKFAKTTTLQVRGKVTNPPIQTCDLDKGLAIRRDCRLGILGA